MEPYLHCICVNLYIRVWVSLSHYLDLERKEERELEARLQLSGIIYREGALLKTAVSPWEQ